MQTQLTTHVSNVLAPASLARKVNLLAALAATPLQSVANLDTPTASRSGRCGRICRGSSGAN